MQLPSLASIGTGPFFLMAGSCAIESNDLAFEIDGNSGPFSSLCLLHNRKNLFREKNSIGLLQDEACVEATHFILPYCL